MMIAQTLQTASSRPATRARRPASLISAIVALAAAAFAIGLAARSPKAAYDDVEAASPGPLPVDRQPTPFRLTDDGVVDWSRLPVEPDPSPMSVAAYGE